MATFNTRTAAEWKAYRLQLKTTKAAAAVTDAQPSVTTSTHYDSDAILGVQQVLDDKAISHLIPDEVVSFPQFLGGNGSKTHARYLTALREAIKAGTYDTRNDKIYIPLPMRWSQYIWLVQSGDLLRAMEYAGFDAGKATNTAIEAVAKVRLSYSEVMDFYHLATQYNSAVNAAEKAIAKWYTMQAGKPEWYSADELDKDTARVWKRIQSTQQKRDALYTQVLAAWSVLHPAAAEDSADVIEGTAIALLTNSVQPTAQRVTAFSKNLYEGFLGIAPVEARELTPAEIYEYKAALALDELNTA
jgi:hypothetical protein